MSVHPQSLLIGAGLALALLVLTPAGCGCAKRKERMIGWLHHA